MVAHLAVEPPHRQGLGKLVPLRLADAVSSSAASGEVRLRCITRQEVQHLPADIS